MMEENVAQFKEMQDQINQLKADAMEQAKVKNTLVGLEQAGLLKGDGQGNYEAVESYEEHQQLMQIRQQEAMIASQHEQRLANEMQLGPDPERIPAG